MKLKMLTDDHMKKFLKENKCDKEKYKFVINSPEECPKDAPKRKAGLIKSRPCDLDEINKELARI
jgi:hypothetical protein